ncbi:MAG: Do family serine endopeptidase [Bacteroidetes bacterium]|nr:MAG: Do family serine endopeptidase [Bacteroidota bacterium]
MKEIFSSRKNILLLTGAALLLTIMGGVLGAGAYAAVFGKRMVYLTTGTSPAAMPQFTSGTHAGMLDGTPDFVRAAAVSRPAVVHIVSRYKAESSGPSDFFGNPFHEFFDDENAEAPEGMASGSGVIISADGYVATNNHVIEQAGNIEVILSDNRSFKAKLVGTDLSTDLALLKIEGENLPHLAFGNSDDIQVGQWVMAVGNPMELTSTVTAGIISAKGRNINLLHPDSQYAIESFIQTDAAVNKGNSGGALVDLNGDLIGINTAIASRTGYYQGYSFAIPATIVRRVMEDLLAFGEVRRGYLGVSIQPVDAELAQEKGLSVLKGAFVSGVRSELGAAKAGMREGDVIVSVNGTEVNSSSELQEQVNRYRPGESIKIKVWRGNEQKEFDVPLMEMPGAAIAEGGAAPSIQYKDAKFRLPSDKEREELGISQGVMVEAPNAAMSQQGIHAGFVITEINGESVSTIEELADALSKVGEYINMKGMYRKGMTAAYSFSWK